MVEKLVEIFETIEPLFNLVGLMWIIHVRANEYRKKEESGGKYIPNTYKIFLPTALLFFLRSVCGVLVDRYREESAVSNTMLLVLTAVMVEQLLIGEMRKRKKLSEQIHEKEDSDGEQGGE